MTRKKPDAYRGVRIGEFRVSHGVAAVMVMPVPHAARAPARREGLPLRPCRREIPPAGVDLAFRTAGKKNRARRASALAAETSVSGSLSLRWRYGLPCGIPRPAQSLANCQATAAARTALQCPVQRVTRSASAIVSSATPRVRSQ